MKIEVILAEEINEVCNGATCFEAPGYISKAISGMGQFSGVVLIDNVATKFSFSSMGMDGDIFTSNQDHRTIVKYLIPLYIYTNIKGVPAELA